MPRDPSKILSETQQVQQERAKQWGDYFRKLIREWQYDDISGAHVFLSKSELARLIKVSDVTINQWWEGNAYPSRQNCSLVANAFEKHIGSVLAAAGYAMTQDDSYNTMNEIMIAVKQDTNLIEFERNRLSDALVTAITPDWIQANPDWIELIRTVLNLRISLIAKAERIASLIDLSKQK